MLAAIIYRSFQVLEHTFIVREFLGRHQTNRSRQGLIHFKGTRTSIAIDEFFERVTHYNEICYEQDLNYA